MPGSITPLPVMLSEEDRAIYNKLEPPKSIVVRYGYQKLIAELDHDGDAKPGCGSKLVIRTERGTELAEMLTTTCPNSGCGSAVSRKDMLQYIENSGGKDYPFTRKGKVLRVASIDDLNEQSRLDQGKTEMVRLCKRLIAEQNLDMKLVEVEVLLGGERVIFYYSAENRVDFRELVKGLAAELHTRIEMCQVNAREEARLVADYEKCGQRCCCKQFLKVLKPVSMKSAKVQKATLDPQKISGRCGRLMCCLRYEDQTYDELRKRLPNRKSFVETEDGIGIVLDSQILTQLVLIRVGAAAPKAYAVEDIRSLTKEESAVHRKTLKEQGQDDPTQGRGRPARGGSGARDSRSAGGGGGGVEGGGEGGRPEPRRPRPGRPLKDQEVESKEGGRDGRGGGGSDGGSRGGGDESVMESRGYSRGDGKSPSADADAPSDGGEGEGGGGGGGEGGKRRRRRRRRGRGKEPATVEAVARLAAAR